MNNTSTPTEPIYEPGRLNSAGLEVFRKILKFLFDVLAPVEVNGLENFALAGPGGFILAANHVSYFDPPLVFIHIPPGRNMIAFGADKYRGHRLFAFVLRQVGVIWVNRDTPTPTVIKAAVQVLRNGDVLGVAPEGTRSRETHALLEGKTGAAYLAITAGVPIIPLGLVHTEKIAGSLKRLRRARVQVNIGKPLRFTAPARHEREAKLQEYTTELMCQLAALLPAEYRGVYADHPRLHQLLNDKAPAVPAEPRPDRSAP